MATNPRTPGAPEMGRAGSDAPPEPRSGGRVLLTFDFRLLAPRTGRESISIVLSLPTTPVCGRRYQKPHLGHSMFCVPKIHRSTATAARPVCPRSSRDVFSSGLSFFSTRWPLSLFSPISSLSNSVNLCVFQTVNT